MGEWRMRVRDGGVENEREGWGSGDGSKTGSVTKKKGKHICFCLLLHHSPCHGNCFVTLQVYVRISDEEWNVYRRYSEFHKLHMHLKKKYPITATFKFPSKKAVGNKVGTSKTTVPFIRMCKFYKMCVAW